MIYNFIDVIIYKKFVKKSSKNRKNRPLGKYLDLGPKMGVWRGTPKSRKNAVFLRFFELEKSVKKS